MQNLSVREFKQKCECIAPKQYIFASINQSWNRVEDPMKLEMSFQIMLIAYNPNAICFKNSSGLMCLERVKKIRLDDETSPLGAIFTIVCGDSSGQDHDVSYTIIAR